MTKHGFRLLPSASAPSQVRLPMRGSSITSINSTHIIFSKEPWSSITSRLRQSSRVLRRLRRRPSLHFLNFSNVDMIMATRLFGNFFNLVVYRVRPGDQKRCCTSRNPRREEGRGTKADTNTRMRKVGGWMIAKEMSFDENAGG